MSHFAKVNILRSAATFSMNWGMALHVKLEK